jgi:hypothetical protein
VEQLVPIKEAATILGLSEITVRRRIRANELLAIRQSTPQGFTYLVVIESAPDDHVVSSSPSQPPDHVPEGVDQVVHPDTDRLIRSLEDRLADAADHIRFLQTELAGRTDETRELRILLSQALRVLPAESSAT